MLRSVLILLAATALSHAATTYNLTSTGCVDASGFESCQADVSALTAACITRAAADRSDLAVIACGCAGYVGDYNCYAQHCWNRVYECEYQEFAAQYLHDCPAIGSIPYFPAPDNAPDSCSCNLGNVFFAIDNSTLQLSKCSGNGTLGFATGDRPEGCTCCALSASISSIYDICPNTDPNLIGLSLIQQYETALNTPFSSCDSYLAEFNCVSDLGFQNVPGGTFYSQGNLPAAGNNTLSNIAGTVTSPASGSVFTYTNSGDSQTYTITAASVNAGSQSTKAGGGKTTATGSSGAIATNSAGAAASPTTSQAGRLALSKVLSLALLFHFCM
ncbi:hypothetical protein BP6252_04793 [Coleophoma cylindrospora]|uniref:Uncharacterized protein n=1 Tax=Coleophoma cylindrospora TaxID=1849047 RepID=A0A3D8S1J4_9HELO|nr:hypothetical protein BP6252_04793 [Coleophoma cylindrospora]